MASWLPNNGDLEFASVSASRGRFGAPSFRNPPRERFGLGKILHGGTILTGYSDEAPFRAHVFGRLPGSQKLSHEGP
jgi:hypothetical protein